MSWLSEIIRANGIKFVDTKVYLFKDSCKCLRINDLQKHPTPKNKRLQQDFSKFAGKIRRNMPLPQARIKRQQTNEANPAKA